MASSASTLASQPLRSVTSFARWRTSSRNSRVAGGAFGSAGTAGIGGNDRQFQTLTRYLGH
ncbi:hypothetical protein [Saccharopolyspora pogona]|uniref:hypothetical protein n=1 Tax=Saccharopolyspora pogona TaxID=333966 RepID=UPI0016830669|nr:hypothetical protein [Saccharopolyspora pogona]